ncbi:hypothetical protein [Pedobacter sp. KLB.chiD]|uniref:hypothetical protein n=1 Tax=Pedobacter sp. KLB.chiD TaxID=3387402 RepID=UPI00399C303D
MKKMHPLYIINLTERTERLAHILNEFKGRSEFALKIQKAKRHKNGALGLWQNFVKIVSKAQKANLEYVIICEDDHQFTKNYSSQKLDESISKAKAQNADILLGGVSWFNSAMQLSQNIFWVDNFSGTQFTIIYQKFYSSFLEMKFKKGDSIDYSICDLTDNVMMIYPLISTQKEFGYSDVTVINNFAGQVTYAFKNVSRTLRQLIRVYKHYKPLLNLSSDMIEHMENIVIPTYVINLAKRVERLESIKNQFSGKPEFDLNIIEACEHEIGAVGLWESIIKVIRIAIQNEDDVIIICEDDHEFTEFYSKEYLFSNILEAHEQGIDYLSGGTAGFDSAIPLSVNRFWLHPSSASQFLVVYSKFFDRILNEAYDNNVIADIKLASLTSNKMVIYPFISRQKDFGYSDITWQHNENPGLVQTMFKRTEARLEKIQRAYIKYTS